MFKKVYRQKEKEDFRDNVFSLIEVTRKSPLKHEKHSSYNLDENVDDYEEALHQVDDEDNIEYSDAEDDIPFFDDDDDIYDYDSDSYYDYDDDANNDTQENVFSSFSDMDASSIDWSGVDFANTDWSQY